MAKVKSLSKKQHDTGTIFTTKSPYGSHKNMVVDHISLGVELNDGEVLCKDDTHYYKTCSSRLDSGLADPNRQSQKMTVKI